MKEMQPLYVATYSEKPAVLEGHPFIVEAGVSLGGAEVSSKGFHLASSILYMYDVLPFCLLKLCIQTARWCSFAARY